MRCYLVTETQSLDAYQELVLRYDRPCAERVAHKHAVPQLMKACCQIRSSNFNHHQQYCEPNEGDLASSLKP